LRCSVFDAQDDGTGTVRVGLDAEHCGFGEERLATQPACTPAPISTAKLSPPLVAFPRSLTMKAGEESSTYEELCKLAAQRLAQEQPE
jgi:hypothetical protein